jgi:hypothetical protein
MTGSATEALLVRFTKRGERGRDINRNYVRRVRKKTRIGRQQFWFFCSRKMTASRHFRPTLNVVATLNPLARREVNLLGKASDCAGEMHKFAFCKVKRP